MSRNLRVPGLRAKVAAANCAPRRAIPVPVFTITKRDRAWNNTLLRLALGAGILLGVLTKAGWLP